jgi:hypothetical protein
LPTWSSSWSTTMLPWLTLVVAVVGPMAPTLGLVQEYLLLTTPTL